MKKDKFIAAICNEFQQSDDLESDEPRITVDSKLSSIDGFDSLSVLSLASLIKKLFGVTIIEKKLNSIEKISELMELIGMEHFED